MARRGRVRFDPAWQGMAVYGGVRYGKVWLGEVRVVDRAACCPFQCL
jgi:hypothetical protein